MLNAFLHVKVNLDQFHAGEDRPDEPETTIGQPDWTLNIGHQTQTVKRQHDNASLHITSYGTKMTFQQELSSWFSPSTATTAVASPPAIGSPAPSTPKLKLPPNQPTILAFLRHCGCPFAEKTFLNLREIAKSHKSMTFIAISHSDSAATDTWLASLPQAGSEPSNLQVIVDEKCEAYAAWGLGVSGYAHALSPWSLYEVWKLGREEGIWNRPTESGSRWQISGTWAVDEQGVVRWGRLAERADDIPDFEGAVGSLDGVEKGVER